MLIYNKDGYQVVQHPHLQYFHINKWSGYSYFIDRSLTKTVNGG
jgi:hypothetical protein